MMMFKRWGKILLKIVVKYGLIFTRVLGDDDQSFGDACMSGHSGP
jgi:hypothetical protein